MLIRTQVTACMVLVSVFLPPAKSSEWDSIYGKVVYANVIFRHGIRAPLKIYPHDPHFHHTTQLWPNGLGELTKAGAIQHYNLGKWLRKRYCHLLPPDGRYNRSAILVMSSDIDRCIMSATANMAGMFPNDGSEDLGGTIWPSVPVHTIPQQFDNVMRLSRPCKRFKAELDKFKKTADYQMLMGPFSDLFSFAAYMSGLNITLHDPTKFGELYITLLIEEMYGIEIPRWWREMYPDKMIDVVGIIFSIPTFTVTLRRLRVGYLLHSILTTMENKMNGSLNPPTQNISVYSAHDSTLASLLHAMDVYNFLVPPFASAVLIELRKNQYNEPVVMIFYKNSTNMSESPVLLRHPLCGEACPLSYLRELWSPMLVEDDAEWEVVCEN